MVDWRLSKKAEADVTAIYVFTHRSFGETQAEAYIEGLNRTFGLIADFPGIGNSADEIKAGFRRFRFQSHLIFYTHEVDHIFIRALIHARRNVRGELFE